MSEAVAAERTDGGAADPVVELLIVGGGPAGLGVARGYREAGGAGSVLLVSADDHAPYARPPLTKDYLRGESGAEDLPLAPDSWYVEQQVELRLSTPVTGVDPERRRVTLTSGDVIGYRSLALATGSSPAALPVPGGDSPGIIYVRDRHSGEALRGAAEPGRRIVVIGSGFIGCEAAASLARRGSAVTLVTDEEVPHAKRLGAAAGARVSDWLVHEGVELVLGDGVRSLSSTDGEWRIDLESGRTLTAETLVSGSGARPNLALAEAAGLVLEGGGVRTDASLRSSDPAIWAAGDLANAHNPAAGRSLRVEHWGEAESMGEIAGANIARAHGSGDSGSDQRWEQAPGFWSGIGDHVLKYSAWGDGYDRDELVEHDGGWAVWYGKDDVLVGVLACDWDEAYERGQELIEGGAGFDQALAEHRPEAEPRS